MAAHFTVKEVASLADVSERAVNKAIEEKVVERSSRMRKGKKRTMLPLHAVAYAAVMDRLDLKLSLDKKRKLVMALKARATGDMTAEPVEIARAVTVDLPQLVGADLGERIASYARSRERVIEENSDVLGGTPVVRGTRISVYSLLGRIEHGETVDSILADYPDLDSETVETAATYARTHPLVGRPGSRPWTKVA